MSQAHYFGAFLQAITHGKSDDPRVASLLTQPAFAVYRNTIFKGLTDALAANFPTVRQLVGPDWFQAAAFAYAQQHLPEQACLVAYGRDFPAFLAAAEAAADLPYLPGVAALDRCWSESHLSADDPLLDTAALHAALADSRDARLVPHAATRWHWDPLHPSYTLWNANRHSTAGLTAQPEWRGEAALLTRPADQVQWRQIGPGACAFLDACGAGVAISQAAATALAHEPALDVAVMLSDLLQAGAFTSFD